MSTSYNVDYTTHLQNTQCFMTPIDELKRQAFIDRSNIESYDIKNWVNIATQNYDHGDIAINRNDLENAYVAYMKGSTIMVEIVRHHSGYSAIKADPVYVSLRKKTDKTLGVLKDLAKRIDNWHSYQHQLQQMSTHYTPIPYTQMGTYADIPGQAPSFRPRSSPLKHTSNGLSYELSNKLFLETPSWTNSSYSTIPMIQPQYLASCIQSQQNPPKVLLIDVRSRNAFMSGCVQHKWIIQIDPSILKNETTLAQVEKSLLNNPEIEHKLFAQRNKFDLVVYYDQNSNRLDKIHMVTMKRLLEMFPLNKLPMMLAGGFDAWQFVVGEKGVYRFQVPKKQKSWIKSNSSASSNSTTESSNQSVYDYFTGKYDTQKVYLPISKPQPLVTRRESNTNRYTEVMPSGSFKNAVEPSPHEKRPAPPAQAKLQRRRTFIDNPFNGFTATNSKLYDVPPVPVVTTTSAKNMLPPPDTTATINTASKSPSTGRPFTLGDFHHTSASSIYPIPSGALSTQGSLVAIGTTGLKNLGNTCYMNSIIQCLSGTIPFARYFIAGVFRQHVNRSNKLGTGGILTERFADLLRAMWNENYNFVSPMTFRDAIVKFAPQFSGTDQHDSQEFLTFLLDGIHEDVNLAKAPLHEIEYGNLPDWQASALSWERYLTRHTSIVVSLFQGQYQSRLVCSTCKHTSTTYTPFMSLSLPIPAKRLKISNVTLYQCLDFFVKEEVLEKEDAWFCSSCGKKRKATKQLTLSRLPDVLLIHLKRFSADGLFKNKLDMMVKYPTKGLDLHSYVAKFIPPKKHSSTQDHTLSTYDLYAVSNHYGSLSGGHYTAYVKDGYRDRWHYFDDSKFSTCDESKVVTKAAYNLFYVRSKVK